MSTTHIHIVSQVTSNVFLHVCVQLKKHINTGISCSNATISVPLMLHYCISYAGLVIFLTLEKLLWIIHYSESNTQGLFTIRPRPHTSSVNITRLQSTCKHCAFYFQSTLITVNKVSATEKERLKV